MCVNVTKTKGIRNVAFLRAQLYNDLPLDIRFYQSLIFNVKNLKNIWEILLYNFSLFK